MWLLLAMVTIGLAACGITAAPQGAGTSGSIGLSLTTVPTVRSVTVSPATASFGECGGGKASRDTKSTAGKLGFPDGECSVGLMSPGIYPITITNTGIASYVYVSGTSASPADDGNQWALCNIGDHPAIACTARRQAAARNGPVPGAELQSLRGVAVWCYGHAGLRSGVRAVERMLGSRGRIADRRPRADRAVLQQRRLHEVDHDNYLDAGSESGLGAEPAGMARG